MRYGAAVDSQPSGTPPADPPHLTAPSEPRARPVQRAIYKFFCGGDWRIGLLALAVTLYYVTTRGIFQGKASGDGFFGFMYLPSLLFHHTIDIAKEVPFWAPILGKEKTGYTANPCPIGPLVFWFPPYLIGLGLERFALAFHWIKPAQFNGQSQFDFWMAGLGSLAAGLGGVGCVYRLLVRKLDVTAARIGTVVATLATPITWYLVTQPLYQHACAFFAVALFVERWDSWRSDDRGLTPTRMAALGAMGGFAMLTRIQEAIFLVLPGIDALVMIVVALRARRGAEAARALAGGALLTVVTFIVFAPQVWIWWTYFAQLRTPQAHGHMRWADPAIVSTIFSMRGGLLTWSPALYLLLPGLLLARKKLGALGLGLGLVFVLELWVNAAAWDHWASWCYGARRFTDATVTFAVGIGGFSWWILERARRLREEQLRRRGRSSRAAVALAVFLTFCVAYNGLLMELLRNNRIKSSGSGAFPASQWIKWAKGPEWLGRLFDTIGYPFAQPAGWIFAAIHHASPRAFEGSIGIYLLERDCRFHAITYFPAINFSDPGQLVLEGITGKPDPADKAKPPLVPVAPRVRLLVPLFARETIRFSVDGDFHGGEARVVATWNGEPLAHSPYPATTPGHIHFEVPERIVHSRSQVNDLTLDLPEGSKMQKVEFQSFEPWWQ